MQDMNPFVSDSNMAVAPTTYQKVSVNLAKHWLYVGRRRKKSGRLFWHQVRLKKLEFLVI